ncbi:MAG TPA: SDR family oxidoreductase [Thermomicrobiales bacterium]|nr:SDR family oxidoreductase [Thermomicrobiales bacterium]
MTDETSIRAAVALVTGAGSGLGEATARAFADAGGTVVCIDRNADATARLLSELPRHAGEHLALACDVREADQVQEAADETVQRLGRIDILVNSAGIDHTHWVEELTVQQWDDVLDVNLRGPFLFAKAAWPQMRQQGRGHIFNIASTSSLRAASGASAYSASKFGLLGLGRALNLEGRTDNIRVTTVIPGGMRTHFFDRFADQDIPMPDPANLQDPANVARAILFAAQMPYGSDVQELVITSPKETAWP